MDETRTSREERIAVAERTAPYGSDASERWTILGSVARVVCYVVIVAAVFAMSGALGGGPAVTMELLLG